jgi:hypothetical protein
MLTETIKIYEKKIVWLKKNQKWYRHIPYLKSTNWHIHVMKLLNFLASTIFSILYALLLQKHIPNNCKVINKMSCNTLCPNVFVKNLPNGWEYFIFTENPIYFYYGFQKSIIKQNSIVLSKMGYGWGFPTQTVKYLIFNFHVVTSVSNTFVYKKLLYKAK